MRHRFRNLPHGRIERRRKEEAVAAYSVREPARFSCHCFCSKTEVKSEQANRENEECVCVYIERDAEMETKTEWRRKTMRSGDVDDGEDVGYKNGDENEDADDGGERRRLTGLL